VTALDPVLDTAEAGRRVVRGGALRVGGFVGGIAASVLGAALVTRHLGPADYGRFQTVVALVTVVQAVTDLGMSTLALREYAQADGEARVQLLRMLLGLRLTVAVAGIGVAAALAAALGYDAQMVAGAALMGVGVLLALLVATLSTPLAAEIRMGAVTALDLSRQLLVTLSYVALVLAGAGLLPFFGVTVPVNAIVLVATVVLVRRRVSLRPAFDRRAWAALVRPTITFALATTVGTLYMYTALVLTSLVASQHETGLFATSFRVYVIVAAVPAVLATTAFPLLSRAARDDQARLGRVAQRLFESTAVLGGAAMVGCVVGAPAVIDVVAGSGYDGAVDVLRIQGVAVGLTFVIAAWGFTLLALRRHRAMMAVNALGLVVSAVTVLVLGRRHGASGAAFGTLLGEAALLAGYLRALVATRPRVPFRVRRVVRALPALALGLAAGLLPVPAAVATAIGLAVYVAGLVALGAVPEEAWDHAPATLHRLRPRGSRT
jgi:O-antigen/teichoic acid export membrane protein